MGEEASIPNETLLGAWDSAFEKFKDELKSNTWANHYLTSVRGITPETIEKFQIGYAPDNWHFLTNTQFNEETGYSPETLKVAGLAGKSESGKIYDFFRNRIVVPVLNRDGRIIGATGRTLSQDTKEPKYFNGPETPIYSKKNNLLGFYQAWKEIRERKQAIFVEGAFDLLQAHQQGYSQVIAPCGTALTPEQLDLVDKLEARGDIEKILMFDGDQAGLDNAERVCRAHLARGLKVALISGDPDEVLRRHYGKSTFDLAISFGAQGGLEFIVRKNLKERGKEMSLTLEDKMLVLQGLRDSFKSLPQEKRGIYTGELAGLIGLQREDIDSFFYSTKQTSKAQTNRSGKFWQSQFIRILVGLAKRERAKNGLSDVITYCDHLGVRDFLTMPEARAAFDYVENHLGDLPYDELGTPLFGDSAKTAVFEKIGKKSKVNLDNEVIESLFNTDLIAYPASGTRDLNQELLNRAIAELIGNGIHHSLGESYDSKKISLEYMRNLLSAIKKGEVHGHRKPI